MSPVESVLAKVDVERACEVMHDAYEAAAVGAGWSTQEASRKPWADVPEANRETMRIAVRALLAHVTAEQAKALRAWVLSDETIEPVARAIALLEPGEDWPTNADLGGGLTGTRDDEYRDGAHDDARHVLAALADLIGGTP